MHQDEAVVKLLPSESDSNEVQRRSFSSWQLWKLIIVLILITIISVWIVFTFFPSLEIISRKSSSTRGDKYIKSSSLYAENCSLVPQKTNNIKPWSGFVQIVPGTLIYSAFYDDTNATFPSVRMIGISETFRPPKLFCHSRCDSQKTEEAKFHVVEDHKNKRHAAFIISCSFPRGLGRVPGAISLSALYDQKRTQIITIPVQSTVDQRHIYNYIVCVPPIYGTEVTPMNFIEFVEMNRILGASNFIIYNEEIHPKLRKVVKIYQDKGVVMVLPWNIPHYLNDFYGIHYHGQQVSIQDCLYRSRGRAKWVGFHDLDEFIVPLKHSSVLSLVRSMDNDRHKSAGYCIRSVLLPRNNVLVPKNDNPLNETLLTQHFVLRTKTVFKIKKRSKCIVDPRKVFEMGIHYIAQPVQDCKETWLNPNKALVFHYRQCIQFEDLRMACKNLVPESFMLRHKTILRYNIDRIKRLIT